MLYIHIGAQKTGSTTIQKALYDNRALLSRNGLKYVDVLPDDSNKVSHYNSVRGFFSSDLDQVEHTRKFIAQIDDPKQNYLISAENLSNWPTMLHGASRAIDDYAGRKRKCLVDIRAAFAAHEVTVILCTRNRADYLKSLFKQSLKISQQFTRSIDQSLHRFLEREIVRSDFEHEAKLWREVFSNLRVINFDIHKGGTLVEAFFRTIDQEFVPSDVVDQNISPDWAALEMRRVLTSLGVEVDGPDSRKRQRFNEAVETYVSNIIRSRCT